MKPKEHSAIVFLSFPGVFGLLKTPFTLLPAHLRGGQHNILQLVLGVGCSPQKHLLYAYYVLDNKSNIALIQDAITRDQRSVMFFAWGCTPTPVEEERLYCAWEKLEQASERR